MPICRSSGACEMWENEFYKHPAPLALRTDNVDSNDLLFAHSSSLILNRLVSQNRSGLWMHDA
jgi:hypothetical protein